MRILALQIEGFRGIRKAEVAFSQHTALVGPNGSGKSTILDALSLTFGRTQLLRQHARRSDALPSRRDGRRILTRGARRPPRLVRDGRGVPKWWSSKTNKVEPHPSADATTPCVQIGLAARFDNEDLKVGRLRYFHDDDCIVDPFDEDAVTPFPNRLLNEIGFFVLPVRRTREATVSFASDLFRRPVATLGGIPAQTLLEGRDRLRAPTKPLESEALLKPLVDRMNEQFRQLPAEAPQPQASSHDGHRFRVTAARAGAALRTGRLRRPARKPPRDWHPIAPDFRAAARGRPRAPQAGPALHLGARGARAPCSARLAAKARGAGGGDQCGSQTARSRGPRKGPRKKRGRLLNMQSKEGPCS